MCSVTIYTVINLFFDDKGTLRKMLKINLKNTTQKKEKKSFMSAK